MAASLATLTEEQQRLFTKLFESLDEDGDNKISVDELRHLHVAITGYKGDVADMTHHATKQMQKLDRDKDGHCNLFEFLSFCVPLSNTVALQELRDTFQCYTKRIKASKYKEKCRVARERRIAAQMPSLKRWLGEITPTAKLNYRRNRSEQRQQMKRPARRSTSSLPSSRRVTSNSSVESASTAASGTSTTSAAWSRRNSLPAASPPPRLACCLEAQPTPAPASKPTDDALLGLLSSPTAAPARRLPSSPVSSAQEGFTQTSTTINTASYAPAPATNLHKAAAPPTTTTPAWASPVTRQSSRHHTQSHTSTTRNSKSVRRCPTIYGGCKAVDSSSHVHRGPRRPGQSVLRTTATDVVHGRQKFYW